jgi:hypothetical protein
MRAQRLSDAIIIIPMAGELRASNAARLVACWVERAEASRSSAVLARSRSSAGPSEVLLSQPELSPQLVGILLGQTCALAVKGGGSLSRLERGSGS